MHEGAQTDRESHSGHRSTTEQEHQGAVAQSQATTVQSSLQAPSSAEFNSENELPSSDGTYQEAQSELRNIVILSCKVSSLQG